MGNSHLIESEDFPDYFVDMRNGELIPKPLRTPRTPKESTLGAKFRTFAVLADSLNQTPPVNPMIVADYILQFAAFLDFASKDDLSLTVNGNPPMEHPADIPDCLGNVLMIQSKSSHLNLDEKDTLSKLARLLEAVALRTLPKIWEQSVMDEVYRTLSVAPAEYDPGLRSSIVEDFREYLRASKRADRKQLDQEIELQYLRRELAKRERQLLGSRKRNIELRNQKRNLDGNLDFVSSQFASYWLREKDAATPHHGIHVHGKDGKTHRSRKRKYRNHE